MPEKLLLQDAEIHIETELHKCFGGGFIEIRLIPNENETLKVFFLINCKDKNSFVVSIPRNKAERLIQYFLKQIILVNWLEKNVARENWHINTAYRTIISWIGINYPEIPDQGEIRFTNGFII